jgi:translation initiation factor IF-3
MAFPPRAPRGAFNPRFRKEQQQEHRTNNMIRVPEVRLVGENIEPGIYPTTDALRMAQELQLDLVEISPGANPRYVRSSITINFCTMRRRRKKK